MGKEREVRKDKKRDTAPTVSFALHDCIARLSYICDRSQKEIGEQLCEEGFESKKVIEVLAARFRRNFYWTDNHLICGKPKLLPYRYKCKGLSKRLHLRFTNPFYDRISELAYALDCPDAMAVAFLLETTVQTKELVNRIISRYTARDLEPNKMQQLREVLRYINLTNPYDEHVSLAMLIAHIVDEVKDRTRTATQAINQWIDKNKLNK